MVVECIIVQKEIIFGIIFVWGILSLGYLYKCSWEPNLDCNLSELVIGFLSIFGVISLGVVIVVIVTIGLIELLPCIRVV